MTLAEENAREEPVDPFNGRTVATAASVAILAIPPTAGLLDAARLMADARIHAVVIADDAASEPQLITDLDLISAVNSGRFQELSAQDLAPSTAVRVREDDSLEHASQLLADEGVTHLIVHDGQGAPTGVLSSLDLARAVCIGHQPSRHSMAHWLAGGEASTE